MSCCHADGDEFDDEDEDLETLTRGNDNAAAVHEAEPLNSEDDEDSDEGGEHLFDTQNRVICQFERVCRRM